MNRLDKPEYQALARIVQLPDGKILIARFEKEYKLEVEKFLDTSATDPITVGRLSGRAQILKEILEQFAKAPSLSQ